MAAQVKTPTVQVPECPVCMDPMTAPIFMCQTGHSLCNTCTSNLLPPICPICRQSMTQMRNWQLEDLSSKAKIPCTNQSQGCVYTLPADQLDNHLKECIFRTMNCPIGTILGKCSWSGKLNELLEHFKERHPSNCNVNSDTDVTVPNINIREDDRHIYMVAQGKLLFILTFKIDTIQNMAFWTIQHIGAKNVAHQHIYEIHVTSKNDSRRKAVFTEHCFNDALKVEEIVKLGKCAVMPLDFLTHFVKDKQLSFRFFIKRLPGPAKNKNDGGSGPSNPGPKGPKPNGQGKGPGAGGAGGAGPKWPLQKKGNKAQ